MIVSPKHGQSPWCEMVCIDEGSVPCDRGDVFHCNDDKGRCIPLSRRCDGHHWQCPGNADEEGCGMYF
jgi:hypothetical protein